MAFRETTIDEIEFLANSFKAIADNLLSVTEKMRAAKHLTLVLQLDAVTGHYLDPCERLAAEVDMHFRDQLHCAKTGGTPKWQRSVQKSAYNKALREAKANLDPAWIKPKPTKKATKKATKRHPKT